MDSEDAIIFEILNENWIAPHVNYIPVKDTIRSIFYDKILRSRHLIIITTDSDFALTWAPRISASVGAKVAIGYTSGNSVSHPSLSMAVRTLVPNLLSDVCILFIVTQKQTFPMNSAVRVASALRANIIYGAKLDKNQFDATMMVVKNRLPNLPFPVMGRHIPIALTLFLPGKSEPMFRNTLAYSHFLRDLSTQFMSYMKRNVIIKSAAFNDTNVLNVVGYNPQYVASTVRCGLRTRFLEQNVDVPVTRILPKINVNDDSDLSNKRMSFIRSSPQMKLSDIDNLALSSSNQIIYVGAHPAKHLEGNRMHSHKLVFIDPELNDTSKKYLKLVSPTTKLVLEKFEFTLDHLHTLTKGIIDMKEPFTIIDDSWIPDKDEYDEFQRMKIQFFARLIGQKLPVTVFMKLNFKSDTTIPYVYALLPQPHGGSINELRLVMSQLGKTFKYERTKIEAYLDSFHALTRDEQLRMIINYHELLMDKRDALTVELSPGDMLSAMFSLSNKINEKKRVLKRLHDWSTKRAFVIFTAPNRGRIEFLLKYYDGMKMSIKIKDDVLTYTSPHRKNPWKDYCYTMEELRRAGYVTVTAEMLAGLMGNAYIGVGYFMNSNYMDIMDIYIPEFVARKLFKYQNIGTSPIGLVKCFTHQFLMNGNIQRGEYYAKRGQMAAEVLKTKGYDLGDFNIVGDETISITALREISFVSEYGNFLAKPMAAINLSGHLLSMAIAAHFVPTAINIWIMQLLTMTMNVKLEDIHGYYDKPVELFDNKIESDEIKYWHSINELILTMEILEDYVSLVMDNNHNPLIIQDIRDSFKATQRLI
nr:MAG: minor capsid protein [Reoviridae sp.]